jgi:hypothetical protein
MVTIFASVLFGCHMSFGTSLPQPSYSDDSNRTELVYGNNTITLEQEVPKTTYKLGEEVTVKPYLVNNGNQNVTVYYWKPSIFAHLYQDGQTLSAEDGFIPEDNSLRNQTLLPHIPNSLDTLPFHFLPSKAAKPNFATTFWPGNYTIMSKAWIRFDSNESNTFKGIDLWSKPLQITVTNETIPEFPFAIPVFLVSITSLIIFYRIKFR